MASSVTPSDSNSSARRSRVTIGLVEPDGFGLRERPAGEFRESGAAPQVKSLIEKRDGGLARRPGGSGQPVFEPGRIKLVPAEAQAVPAVGGDKAVTGRAEHAAEPGDLCPQRGGRVLGKRFAPQLIYQAVCGDELAAGQDSITSTRRCLVLVSGIARSFTRTSAGQAARTPSRPS